MSNKPMPINSDPIHHPTEPPFDSGDYVYIPFDNDWFKVNNVIKVPQTAGQRGAGPSWVITTVGDGPQIEYCAPEDCEEHSNSVHQIMWSKGMY